jgi:hypothetical protein
LIGWMNGARDTRAQGPRIIGSTALRRNMIPCDLSPNGREKAPAGCDGEPQDTGTGRGASGFA